MLPGLDGLAIIDAAELPVEVARRKVGIKSGHFYVKRLVDALRVPDGVRPSMVHYNTLDEAL